MPGSERELIERSDDVAGASEALGLEAYRALYDHNPDGVLFTVPDGRVLAANQAACRILAMSEDEIRSAGRQGLADPTDVRWAVLLAERERTGHVQAVARMIRGDGAPIEVEMSARIFRQADGEQRTCTIIRDVTERITMERELRRSQERLAEAERVAGIGSWEWDIIHDRVTWSDGLFRIYGLALDEFDPTVAGGHERVYPDDRQHVQESLERALAERSSFVLEYRALRADGRVRTLRNQAEVVVAETGEPIRVVGIVHDITDARAAQQALQTTSSDLERRALELQRLALRTTAEPAPEAHAQLTPRQFEIVRLIAEGMTNAQIATRLVLTEGTVKWHVSQILQKTSSPNRVTAVARVLGATR